MGAMWKPTVLFLNVALLLMPSTEKAVAIGTTNGATQAQTAASSQGELKYKVPDGWVVEHPTSGMRAAQYKLPKADGDTEDGNLVLYYFGQGQGGSTEANIDRWINQMQQPDGRPSREKAKSETMTVNGLKVTTVDVAGTYVAETSPGSGTFSNNPNYRLHAAVVETPKGSYYVKLVGPEKTVTRWDKAFTDYVKSFEFK
jgi:hypothetical protein